MKTSYLNQWETSELFEEIYVEQSLHQMRNIAIFEIAKYCALRVSEITNMQLSDYCRSVCMWSLRSLSGNPFKGKK